MSEETTQIVIPPGILSPEIGRKVLISAVIFIIATSIITQAFVQLGGGPRNDDIDLTDQITHSTGETHILEGLPPFISSGGVYQPEKTIFTIGLSLSGLLFIVLGIDFGTRTHRLLSVAGAKPWRRVSNVASTVAAIGAGVSLMMIPQYPFDVSLVAHLFYAITIFYCSFFWVFFSHLARSGSEDDSLTWRGYRISTLRKYLLLGLFVSLILTIYAPPAGYMLLGAFFEWMLLLTSMGGLLSNMPAFDEGRIIPGKIFNA